jgi:hypothetical protein
MWKRKYLEICILFLAFFIIYFGESCYGNQNRQIPKGCKWIEIETGPFQSTIEKVINKIDFDSWPQSDKLKVFPNIRGQLLKDPNLVLYPSINPDGIFFAGNRWTECECKWTRQVEISKPLPTELPPERKKRLLEILPEHKRNDPNFVAEYLKRKLDRERSSKRYKFAITGEMSMRLCMTPCSLAAQEYIVSNIPLRYSAYGPERIVYMFSESNRLKNLGTIAFHEQWGGFSHIMFLRDNIAVVIDARGKLAGEALPLAQKIDALIQKQPALTYEQILARRPTITMATKAEKTLAEEQWTVSFDTSAPAGQEIVDVKSYVDGQLSWIEDKKVVITNKKKGQTVKVKIVATTGELLTNTLEREVTIPE